MAKYSDEEWEEIGKKWREAAGMNDAPRLNAPEFIRWLKRAGHIKDYVLVPDHELPSAYGKYDPNKETCFYRESVWNDAERGISHAIWTLVHEGCHGIQGHKETRYRALGDSKLNRFSRRAPRDETEADRLTACILAPFDKADFRPGMTADDLMQRFGLSRPAAKIRLEEFERLYRRKHKVPRELPKGVIDFLQHQKQKGFIVRSIDSNLLPQHQANYEGDPCPACGALKLIRIGLCMRCDNCGARTGDD